jgi:capsid assembly protease
VANPYRRSIQFVKQQRWALLESKLDVICEILAMRANGITLSEEEIQTRIGAVAPRASNQVVAGVAVLPLYGVIAQKMNNFTAISGGTSLDVFMSNLRQLVADRSVLAIAIDVDSPGGSVFGVQEAADEMYALRGKKPMVAVADPMIASAAFWLACGADEISCMPSGEVGSVGVMAVHEDWSAANEQIGVKPTYIYAGQYKTELNPDNPLSPEALGYVQSQVDATYSTFTRFVAKGRGVSVATVRDTFGQGRMLMAKDALAAKMIDRIETLDQAVQRLARAASSQNRSPAAAMADDRAGERQALVIDGELPTEREFEEWMRREAGFTREQAKGITAKGYRQVRREAMASEEGCNELLALLSKRAAIFTGAQRS